MKNILQKTLAVLARATILNYKPMVIGITGSVGKTSTREAIYTVVKKKYRVRTAEKNYNNEIGLPLTILGIPHHGKNVVKWFFALFRVLFRVVLRDRHYPEVVVLEYGVDRPGDMDYLLSIARPAVAVVTAIGDIPVHVEFFENPEAVIREKTKLVQSLPPEGYAVLNHDDYAVYAMKSRTSATILTYGMDKHADIKIVHPHIHSLYHEKLGSVPDGMNFKIEHGGRVVPIRLHKALGIPSTYAASAAAAVGIVMNMNWVEISEALGEYSAPPGRLRLLEGIKHSFVIDDTYNAAPESMRRALETLRSLPGKRKIAVLGDMLEIGRYSEQAHRAIGDRAAEFVDLLITVGPRAKFIADEALTRGIEPHARELTHDQVLRFDDSASAGRALDPLLQEGDLVLVKGSQALRMEKVVEEIMAYPERAAELLVRQQEEWKRR